jgi:hypothetical protein
MGSEQIYYTVFSAALMADSEPDIAQRLAYLLAYLTDNPPEILHQSQVPDSQASLPIVASAPVDEQIHVHPINPLSHVDWLRGGILNQRGQALGRRQHPRHTKVCNSISPATINPVKTCRTTPTERFKQKMNRAILLALMETDQNALIKFALSLFCYCKTEQADTHVPPEAQYWLLMCAIRCYRYGTTFQWQKNFAVNTDRQQQNHPMYPVVKALQAHLIQPDDKRSDLYQYLVAQMDDIPCEKQVQCLIPGLAFRRELLHRDDSIRHRQALFTDLDRLDTVMPWLSEN